MIYVFRGKKAPTKTLPHLRKLSCVRIFPRPAVHMKLIALGEWGGALEGQMDGSTRGTVSHSCCSTHKRTYWEGSRIVGPQNQGIILHHTDPSRRKGRFPRVSAETNILHQLITSLVVESWDESIRKEGKTKKRWELRGKGNGVLPRVGPKFDVVALPHFEPDAFFELLHTSTNNSPHT